MKRPLTILGIDPGTRRIGYGVIRKERGVLSLLEADLLVIKSRDDLGALLETKKGIDAVLKKYRPDVVAVEKLYFSKNQKTGIQVAQARGLILLSALEHAALVREYGPNEIKSHLTGYGLADKKAVAKMVRLTLRTPKLAVIDDISDALAVALVASQDIRDWPLR